jgi:hypothetical protein
MADITQNPDYKLVMTFLQNIRPGDMDAQSAEQLMAIGQRIQNGGTLTEREREMLNSVVRAMPHNANGPRLNAVREGEMPMAQMPMDPEGEARLAMDSAMPSDLSPEDMDRFMAQKNAAMNKMPSLDGMTYGPSSGVTTMDMQQMIDAGIINPNRPRPRPENLGQMRPRPRPASME